ncbi:hypothetical protein TWF225_009140 [Orbilia oligospora]|uniref:SGTA homodimerisation domain-containing protein n=1 Tax=Orbilia oligospora TaxID=2813651 RepID=A0A8H2E3G9_ORBOL|nr:hypothetical protein TWF225_009140 [Orbilia oligospora]KAF3233269.1 hypothetical protein TWF128_003213 [Orbilia oligospora]KAF3265816.1 hypothetical protein TWF217_002346 [Orbilia oligospora]KAF3286458.1 hypothetical protein TWF132_008884 [Orbilia oligospora]TGJ71845.1 hypothetical protein EYR41_003775 [Orbilia oligospora]
MASETKKRLALAIIDFLQTSVSDGTLPADEKESVEAAQELISGAFGVSMTDSAAMKEALGGQSLLKIYEVFEKMKAKGAGAAAAAASSPAGSASGASPKASNTPSAEDKASAEALKGRGNQAMAQKKYPEAIDLYSQALKLVPGNPIYLSNRAAAYSASSQHEKARDDAQAAIEADPAYSKGWSRLGLAKFALGDAKGAMIAYEKGIQAEGKGGSEAMRKGYETAKRRVEEDESAPVSPPQEEPLSRGSAGSPFGGGGGGMPDLSALAGMMGGGGGGPGGPGGMDFNSIMSNPMFSQMAQSLMSNPSLMNNLMNNPKIKDMMSGAGGGGMPDIGALMSDPSIAELAKNFMPGGPSSKK